MKFASNSYTFQLIFKQNYWSFCIGIQQNSHTVWIYSHTFSYAFLIVRTLFPSIWFFCDFISNTYHFVFMYNCNLLMKFAPDSYTFQTILTQNSSSFCIEFQRNLHNVWIYSNTFWKLFIYSSYIVHKIFQSIWFFCDLIIFSCIIATYFKWNLHQILTLSK